MEELARRRRVVQAQLVLRNFSEDPGRETPKINPLVCIILPTFNEANNLPSLIPGIVRTLAASGFECSILVVDDASPDGTAHTARELSEQWPVEVIERRGQRGLATAVLTGFERAEADICLVMDADGSHPLEALPRLAEAVGSGRVEIAVGSRLAKGGGFDSWPLWGRIKSRFAASIAVGLTSMTDPTTGLMAVRRDLLAHLDLDPIGWKIVLEVVVKAAPKNFEEVPIIFGPRLRGRSKQSLRVLWQYLCHCARLYRYQWRQRHGTGALASQESGRS